MKTSKAKIKIRFRTAVHYGNKIYSEGEVCSADPEWVKNNKEYSPVLFDIINVSPSLEGASEESESSPEEEKGK